MGGFKMTLAVGPPEEGRYFNALTRVNGWRLTQGRLELMKGDEVLLVFQRAGGRPG